MKVLAVGNSERFLIFSNKKNEVFRWIFNEDDSMNNAYNIPMQEKEKGVFTKFFCEPRGNHTIIKHNKNIYYFHLRSSKILPLLKLRDINVESIGWDEKAADTYLTTSVSFNLNLANPDRI